MSLPPEVDSLIQRHQSSWPVKIGNIAKELGLTVLASDLPSGVSGTLRQEGGRWVIRVNRRETKERQRFTVAHEVAHFILHRHLVGDGISDDTLYRSRLSDRVEREANRLAAEILMPWTLIDQAVKLGVKEADILAEQFDVSKPAMYARLGIPA